MRPDRARVLTEGLVTGFVGYLVVVLFYGVLNLLTGSGFFHTAAVLGQGLVAGEGAVPAAGEAGAVLAFNGVHVLAFLVIGLVAAWLVMQTEKHPSLFIIVLFAGLAGLFITLGALYVAAAATAGELPFWSVVVANLLAGVGMGAYLLRAHPRLWAELRDGMDPETEHPRPR